VTVGVAPPWSGVITDGDVATLHSHLFQDDGREHAAFILAGVATGAAGNRLLMRQVLPVDDADFILGEHGYRIVPRAVVRAATRARTEGLTLVWAHSHPGSGDSAGFSSQDRRTIAEAHPALLDITGSPVAALVFGEGGVAGEVWTPEGERAPLVALRVLGPAMRELKAGSWARPKLPLHSARHARQILIFGEAGQERLRKLRVAVVGAGGGGSLMIEQLAHLGVGEIWIIDCDRVSWSNLSRIVGSWWLDALLRRWKVRVARRMVRRIDPTIKVRALISDAGTSGVARELGELDALFAATDTAVGRHAVNAVAYQYMVPAFGAGAKVQADDEGQIATIHTAARIALAGRPCWHCQGAIPPDRLHREQLGDAERRAQDYLGGGEDVADPSVISLNAIAASTAVTDFLMMFTGLMRADADLSARVWHPLERRAARRPSASRPGCGWCDATEHLSAYARGDTWPLGLPAGPGALTAAGKVEHGTATVVRLLRGLRRRKR